jgi:hydrogenase maturation protein HypF
MPTAYSIHISGVVQGVGFRPFVYRLARTHGLAGWILNAEDGVEIHLEGNDQPLQCFIDQLKTEPPPAAAISAVQVQRAALSGFAEFTIRSSSARPQPTVRVSPDLPICANCLEELFDRHNRRYHYPYINCTNCGPRYTVIRSLPYDRANTTMAAWPLDGNCSSEYHDPSDRRFHAQPIACPDCGPHMIFRSGDQTVVGDEGAISEAAAFLRAGKIVAVKGLGGYHLACDARNAESVAALRMRKYRKEKPFALMAKSVEAARQLVELTPETESRLASAARPIVLARAKFELSGVAPDNDELGVMLPYTPVHHLLFAAESAEILVMTSANRSSEPIAYVDEDALQTLSGIADGFLLGERPIARRVDDSVVRASVFGPAILRRARGCAPGAVTTFPVARPILALGADLKNTVTLVVDGQAFVSQHIGDLEHYEVFRAFQETIDDLLSMYEIRRDNLLVVHDAHPQYVSAQQALRLHASEACAVQHHRAHIASVLAERRAWNDCVVGVSFDGTGYGDDGSIWGGEFFAGSLRTGFERVAHLRSALLPGGDAAAAHPAQAAAGFLVQVDGLPDMAASFAFPSRYLDALELIRKGVRTFTTTSVGRLFDAAAALLGFTREISFEGQAAMWVEHLARQAASTSSTRMIEPYPFPFAGGELDFRPLLSAMIQDRVSGRDLSEVARAFQRGVAAGLADALQILCARHETNIVALSGGVFQNELLLADFQELIRETGLRVWTNHQVPSNDGGISLGQAAMAVFGQQAHVGSSHA